MTKQILSSLGAKLAPEKAREAVLLALFALNSQSQDESSLVDSMMQNLKITRARAREALLRAQVIHQKQAELIALLSPLCKTFEWSRVAKLEQSALLLGAFELKFDETIPPKVVLAEATRLAKKFSGPLSSKFVNAVLDALYHGSREASLEVESDEIVERLLQEIREGAEIAIEPEARGSEVKELKATENEATKTETIA